MQKGSGASPSAGVTFCFAPPGTRKQYAWVCEATLHSHNTFHLRIIEPPTAFALRANLVKNWPAALSLSSSSLADFFHPLGPPKCVGFVWADVCVLARCSSGSSPCFKGEVGKPET